MARSKVLGLVGSETLLGREIRDLISSGNFPVELKLIAADEEESGTLTEHAGEAMAVTGLDEESLGEGGAVFLTGSDAAGRKALDAARRAIPSPAVIDLTYASEDCADAVVRAPMVEPPGHEVPGKLHVIAHPAAIATALFLRRLHGQHPIRRSVIHVFEPASERGAQAIDELQQQTASLLSFKALPKKVFDAQLSFNLLASYGEEAAVALETVELRMERHLATLLSLPGGGAPSGEGGIAPMPSLRLIQVPLFHGHCFSLWVEFENNPGVETLERALSSEHIDVRGGDLEPPTAAGMAGESGIAVGAVALDRNHRQASWFWMVSDNLRLSAENALAVARQML